LPRRGKGVVSPISGSPDCCRAPFRHRAVHRLHCFGFFSHLDSPAPCLWLRIPQRFRQASLGSCEVRGSLRMEKSPTACSRAHFNSPVGGRPLTMRQAAWPERHRSLRAASLLLLHKRVRFRSCSNRSAGTPDIFASRLRKSAAP